MTIILSTFSTVKDLPLESWDRVAQNLASPFLLSNHLKAVEASGINTTQHYYMLGQTNTNIDIVSYFFIMNYDVSSLWPHLDEITMKTLRYWFPDFLKMKMLECGFLAGLGKTIFGYHIEDTDYITPTLTQIEKTATDQQVDFILIRDLDIDFYEQHRGRFEQLGYFAIVGYPIARMELPWSSFDEYLSSLKSNTLREFNRHHVRLNQPEVHTEIIHDFGSLADTLFTLWCQVHKNGGSYEHEMLSPEYFREINSHMAEDSYIHVIKRHERIIAFALCIMGSDELISLYLGIDYQWNQTYNLYFNLHFLAIQDAIRLKKKSVNFGITSYEFKMLIGCELQSVIYLFKHMKMSDASPVLARLLEGSIDYPENNHRPFKNQDISGRVHPAQISAKFKHKEPDIFRKAEDYARGRAARMINLHPYFKVFQSAQEPVVQYEGKSVVMIGSNAYLGLSTHPDVIAASKMAIDQYGTGCSGSPFLNGNLDLHENARSALADFMQKEDAILFSTGFQTNLGVVGSLGGRHDILIMDDLNHASLYDGARYSFGKVVKFKHNDMNDLEDILKTCQDKPKLIISDSVFSMEGHIVNLPDLVALKNKYHARLMLDEAHGIGVMGPGGRGVAEHFDLLDEVDLIMGTFSKSFAAVGGFIAGSRRVIDFLRHVSRPYIFSATLPPSVIGTVMAALIIIQTEPWRRERLLHNARFLAEGLTCLGYQARFTGTPIVPVHCGSELIAYGMYSRLLAEGVYVNPVISPAVPGGQELLRTSFMATHTDEMLQRALDCFERVKTPYYPQPVTL